MSLKRDANVTLFAFGFATGIGCLLHRAAQFLLVITETVDRVDSSSPWVVGSWALTGVLFAPLGVGFAEEFSRPNKVTWRVGSWIVVVTSLVFVGMIQGGVLDSTFIRPPETPMGQDPPRYSSLLSTTGVATAYFAATAVMGLWTSTWDNLG